MDIDLVIKIGHKGVLFLGFLRNLQTDFQEAAPRLCFLKQFIGLFPHIHTSILVTIFLIMPILTGMKQNFNVTLIHISLTVEYIE